MTPLTSKQVPLSIPLHVVREGASVEVNQVTVKRPRTRHTIRLATIIGPDLVRALVGDIGSLAPGADKIGQVDIGKLFDELLPKLFEAERLGAALDLLADLTGLSTQEAGDLDPLDTWAVIKAVADFFPALSSFAPKSSQQT